MTAQLGAKVETGETEQVNATLPVKEFVPVTVTVALADAPGATEAGVGAEGSVSVKPGAALIVRRELTVKS